MLTLGGIEAEMAGSVAADGTLALRGQRSGTTYTLTVRGWRSRIDGPDMHGTFSYVIAPEDERLGSVVITATVETHAARR